MTRGWLSRREGERNCGDNKFQQRVGVVSTPTYNTIFAHRQKARERERETSSESWRESDQPRTSSAE